MRSPYIYAEDNWTDDMELANAIQIIIDKAREESNGLNGYILLLHVGTDSKESISFIFC